MLQQVPGIMAAASQVEIASLWLLDGGRLEFVLTSSVGLLGDECIGARQLNCPDTPLGFVSTHGGPVVTMDDALEHRFPVPGACVEVGLTSAVVVPLIDRGRVMGMWWAQSTVAGRFGDEEARFLESLASLVVTGLQRVKTDEALLHAQRLESVGPLTGGIAHAFNNLLTVIQGNLQVLEEPPTLAHDAQAQPLLRAAARASRRGAELTGELLAVSRRQVLQPIAVDTRALRESLADLLRRTLDQRISIEIDVAPEDLLVMADPGQPESALLDIAINARDAMPQGGTLCFATRPVAISITDSGSGSGMSDEVRERAFEPFFTTKEAGRGPGRGLSTVHGSTRRSRGTEHVGATLDAGDHAWDLLLTDVALGTGMRGTRLADEAQRRCPYLAVLLMSGFSSERRLQDRAGSRHPELLRKPFAPSELARAMARVRADPA